VDKILLTDEAKAKNFLGRYTSKNVSDLVNIKKLYEKDNIHIASLAKQLGQNISFEVPAIQKAIQNLEA